MKGSMKKFLLVVFVLLEAQCLCYAESKIVIISDLNGSYGSRVYGKEVHQAIKKIVALKPDLVLSTGDMVAGQKSGLDYSKMWEAFHQAVTIPLQNNEIPLAVAVGNHDGSGYAQYKNERQIFISEWKKYKPDLTFSNSEFYPQFYSFIFDEKLFIALDTTVVGELSTQQLLWLESELRKDSQIKQKILFTHVPLFGFADMSGTGAFFDPFLYGLLSKYRVTFYLTGHHHAYYPGFYQGTHFVSQGCLGSAPRTLVGIQIPSPRTITVIDFKDDKNFEISAYEGPMFEKKVDHRLLPSSIKSDTFDITLRDQNVQDSIVETDK